MVVFFQNLVTGFKKNPVINILFVIQIAVTAFVLFVSCFEVKYASDELKTVNETYTDYYFYRFEPNYPVFDSVVHYLAGYNIDGFVEKMDSVIEEFKTVEDLHPVVNICNGSALTVYDSLESWDEEGCSDSEFSLVHKRKEGKTTVWKKCFTDKDYYDMFGRPRMDSGRFFTDSDFALTYKEGTTVPVLLGFDFKRYCRIGDIFDSVILSETGEHVKLEVVGFIAENEVYLDINGNTLFSFDRVIVLPFNDRRFNEYTPAHSTEYDCDIYMTFASGYHFTMLLVKKDNYKEVVERMMDILKNNGLSDRVSLAKPRTSTVSIANNYKENMNIRIVLTIITVLFAFISVVLMTVNKITSNIRNYAVHLISGGTYRNICLYVSGETAVCSVIGFVLGSEAYSIRNIMTNYAGSMPAESGFGFAAGWIICGSMLILFVVLTLLIVLMKMKFADLSAVIRDNVYADGSRGRIYKAVTIISFAVISFCIIFTVSYYVHINSVDMYYRHFYTDHTKKVMVVNDPSQPDADFTPKYKGLAEDYVIDKFVTISYSDEAPYIRGTYCEGDVALPNMLEGRYFSEEELNGGRSKKVVVMGRKAYEDFATVREDGTAFFTYYNTDYEVIGIMGKEDGTETRIDEWSFMPLDTAMDAYGKIGTYFIDGRTKKNVEDANEAFLSALEGKAQAESSDQTLTEIIIGPTDALISLAIMIVLNTVIVCIYYTDKKQYVMSVKKYVGYSKTMIFCDVFAGFLRWAAAGFLIGTLAVLTIIMTSLGKYIMFSALSLNVPTVIISLVMVSLTALVFTFISVFRIYRGDISRSIRE